MAWSLPVTACHGCPCVDQVDVLVATDLASRGLDIPGISRIINYELPDNMEDYVHRCGGWGCHMGDRVHHTLCDSILLLLPCHRPPVLSRSHCSSAVSRHGYLLAHAGLQDSSGAEGPAGHTGAGAFCTGHAARVVLP